MRRSACCMHQRPLFTSFMHQMQLIIKELLTQLTRSTCEFRAANSVSSLLKVPLHGCMACIIIIRSIARSDSCCLLHSLTSSSYLRT